MISMRTDFGQVGGEAVASLGKDLYQVVSQVTTSLIQPKDGIGHRRGQYQWISTLRLT